MNKESKTIEDIVKKHETFSQSFEENKGGEFMQVSSSYSYNKSIVEELKAYNKESNIRVLADFVRYVACSIKDQVPNHISNPYSVDLLAHLVLILNEKHEEYHKQLEEKE